MFCVIPRRRHRSLANLDVKCVSLSLMIFVGNPNLLNTWCMYRRATPSAVIVSEQGRNNTILVHPWSVMVRIVSYLSERGNLVMKSIVTVWKGRVSTSVVTGNKGAFWVCVLILLA